jgi:hypothetical protein
MLFLSFSHLLATPCPPARDPACLQALCRSGDEGLVLLVLPHLPQLLLLPVLPVLQQRLPRWLCCCCLPCHCVLPLLLRCLLLQQLLEGASQTSACCWMLQGVLP